MKSALRSPASLILLSVSLLGASALTQNTPVPQVVGPPHPLAVAPGGGDFTLKVYGANFVPGAVVNWNRQPRATTYISGHEVDATILASDIVSNTAGYITVTNPPPGGGNSSASWTLVEVHDPTATIVPGEPTRNLLGGTEDHVLLIADFTNDGILDLATGSGTIRLELGNGDGTFNFVSNMTYSALSPFGDDSMAYGDFNGDGNVDLAYAAGWGSRNNSVFGMAVNFGDGKGTFVPGWQYRESGEAGSIGVVVAGDLNRDGSLDLVAQGPPALAIFLGNGDGSFAESVTYPNDLGGETLLADFNGDGILDLLIQQQRASTFVNPITIAFGNGDGTFKTPVTIATPSAGCGFGPNVLVTDFNGDGNLDIAFCTATSIGVQIGNGDGTFQKPTYYDVSSPDYGFTFAVGDFNSDGHTDLLVSAFDQGFLEILLGNGDGTFQPRSQVKLPGPPRQSGEEGIGTGDFNSDGLLDFVFQLDATGYGVYLQQ
jgi:hypothetical protein